MKIKHIITVILLAGLNAWFTVVFMGIGLGLFAMFGNVVNFGLFSVTLVHLVAILVEIFIASLLVAGFVGENSSVSYRKRFMIIGVIFLMATFLLPGLSGLYTQKKHEFQNPVSVGEKEYDFTKPFSLTGRHLVVLPNSTLFKDNKVFWVEQTKSAPPFTKNKWDVMMFEFNPQTQTGITTNLTDSEKASINSKILFNDNVLYWIESNGNFTAAYSYDLTSKKKKKIANNIFGIFGVYKNKLLLNSNGDLSVLNLENNEKISVSFNKENAQGDRFLFGGGSRTFGKYAPSLQKNVLWLYNIEDNSLGKEVITDSDLFVERNVAPGIFCLNDTWLGYTLPEKEGSLRMYNRVSKDVLNLDQYVSQVGEDLKFTDMYPKPVLQDSILYYVLDTSLISLNLDTKEKQVLIADYTPRNTEFYIEGNYVLRYMTTNPGEHKVEPYLYPINSSK